MQKKYLLMLSGPGLRTRAGVEVDPARAAIVEQFAALPDEAFQFFVGTIVSMSHEAGGFQSDSRAAIEALGQVGLVFLERGKDVENG